MQTVRHEQVFTIPEMLDKVKFEGESPVFAKNLFLHNKKKKELVYLVIAAHDTAIDMKGLTTHLKAASGCLRAGDEDVMDQLLGAKKVHLIVDQRLLDEKRNIAFHPMQNDATTSISVADMKRVIALSDHEAEALDFSKIVEGEKKEDAKKPAAPQKGKEAAKKEEVK